MNLDFLKPYKNVLAIAGLINAAGTLGIIYSLLSTKNIISFAGFIGV